jgi:hypothetical protein
MILDVAGRALARFQPTPEVKPEAREGSRRHPKSIPQAQTEIERKAARSMKP